MSTRSESDTAPGRDYNDEEVAFLKAVDEYKRAKGRPFPTLCELLKVLKSLGYRKLEGDDNGSKG